MDHLPLPPSPTIGSLDVPFLCREQYDGGPFLTYPSRNGWNVTEREFPDRLYRAGKEVKDMAEIVSFLQTWLYFGLLFEFTGKAIDVNIFKAPGRTRNAQRFSSKHLVRIMSEWSLEVASVTHAPRRKRQKEAIGKSRSASDPISHWLTEREDVLKAALALLGHFVDKYEDRWSTALSLVCLSIAALGDYLSKGLADIALAGGHYHLLRRTVWKLKHHVCQPLLGKMESWCPNRLHSLVNVSGCTSGVLWYIANLNLPKVHDGHRTCTPEKCNSLSVDQHVYTIKHISSNCHCNLIGPSMRQTARIVGRGSVALFTVQHDAGNTTVSVQDASGVEEYVAISHVWADGLGNMETNELPACVLERIQKYVNALAISPSASPTPIWMDTICLPRYPVALRRKAVLQLSEIFSKASGVLVLDSSLQPLDCSDMQPIEIFARISISGWTSRLWTLSEGYLAKRIWFQFGEKAVDYYALNNHWSEIGVPFEMMNFAWANSGLLYGSGDREPSLRDMKATLSSRQTSWPSDEALCLGAILRLDLSRIVDVDDSKKMAAFWQQIEIVSTAVIFVDCTPKLEDPGCRWAPATMLGGTNQGLVLLDSVGRRSYARPTKSGLEFSMPEALSIRVLRNSSESARRSMDSRRNFINYFCQLPESLERKDFLLKGRSSRRFIDFRRQLPDGTERGEECLLKDQSGRWFGCFPILPWHQTPSATDFEHDVPVLFVWLQNEMFDTKDYDDPLGGEPTLAVFATHKPSSPSVGQAQVCRAHTVHLVGERSEEQRHGLDELVGCAARFTAQQQRQQTNKIQDDDGGDEILRQILWWLRDHYTQEALIQLTDSVVHPTLIDEDIGTRLLTCAEYIRYFCLVGEWYKVGLADPREETKWCID